MSPVTPSPWSPQQRRWLQALGHVVWRAGAGDAEAESAPMPATQPPVPVAASVAAVPRRAPPPATDAAGEPAVPAPARTGSMSRPAQMPDRLRLALLRASGLDPADPAAMAAMAQWPVEELRRDAAAKRAFWPRLRALRKRPA